MTAKDKIEQLRDGWYGFDLFSAVMALIVNGFGFFRLGYTAALLVASLALTWFLGRRLLARSSITRLALVVVSGVMTVVATLGLLKACTMFLASWSFSSLALIVLGVAGVWMNLRSFRVLRDPSVKTYFA